MSPCLSFIAHLSLKSIPVLLSLTTIRSLQSALYSPSEFRRVYCPRAFTTRWYDHGEHLPDCISSGPRRSRSERANPPSYAVWQQRRAVRPYLTRAMQRNAGTEERVYKTGHGASPLPPPFAPTTTTVHISLRKFLEPFLEQTWHVRHTYDAGPPRSIFPTSSHRAIRHTTAHTRCRTAHSGQRWPVTSVLDSSVSRAVFIVVESQGIGADLGSIRTTAASRPTTSGVLPCLDLSSASVSNP